MRERKIEMVAKKVSFSDAEAEDLKYWMDLSTSKRLEEMTRWKKNVWELAGNAYPKIEKIAEKIIKFKTDRDEF